MTIAERYIDAKYRNATREELISLRKEAAKELRVIKDSKSQIFVDYHGVHGRFQQSQLDVLDIRESKICAVIDNVDAMIAKHAA